MKYDNTVKALILGVLISIVFGIAFQAGQYQASKHYVALEQNQVLLDSKIHLIELKFDAVADQKESIELQNDFDRIMEVLETSHAYTGEGIIARDQAMREAAQLVNDSIAEGGRTLVHAIENLLREIEKHLHQHESASEQEQ